MLKVDLNKSRGFTLIEITIALAIAGLLLSMVFVALQGANRERRDTQRKSDVDKISSQLESYANNNKGLYPPTQAAFAGGTFWGSRYITDLGMRDPTTHINYATAPGWPAPGAATRGTVYYRFGNFCDNSPTTRGYSVRIGLEAGEACRDGR